MPQKLLRGDEWKWQIIREIGRGRFGVVSEAVNEKGRRAAVKRLRARYAQTGAHVRRMLWEFTALRSLCHRAFPEVIDQGLTDGLPFFVTELLDGESLEARRQAEGGRLSVDFVLSAAVHVLDGLSYAHHAGIIHSDISPNNLYVTKSGETKLLDLGLCHAVALSGSMSNVAQSSLLGTPGFIAPERCHGDWSAVDARADLWSLGAVLFVLLTGQPARVSQLEAPIPEGACLTTRTLSGAAAEVPDDVAHWLDRALAPHPSERWQHADEMRRALCDLLRQAQVYALETSLPRSAPSQLSECPTTADPSDPNAAERLPQLALHVVYCPDGTGRRHIPLLPHTSITLGRDPKSAQWYLDDEQISRCHARIDWDDETGGYRLVDLGSRNGTRVNAARCNVEPLAIGDVIRLGQSLLVVVDEEEKKAFEQTTAAVSRSTAPLLLVGETGVGKDRLARLTHERSRRTGEFVAVNCAALTPELAASELFGHERGAFSGADRARVGLFRAADHGTLLLDEVGDIPRSQQAVFLRTLQDSRVRPVGSATEYAVDVRVIAATNVPLESALTAGQFRLDLYARLSALTIRVPALRERRHEILAILHDVARCLGLTVRLDTGAAEALILGEWATNVRGLQRLLTSFASSGEPVISLSLAALQQREPGLVTQWRRLQQEERCISGQPPSGRQILRERTALQRCLEDNDGNVSHVARQLGTTRAQVYRWMKRLGIGLRSGG